MWATPSSSSISPRQTLWRKQLRQSSASSVRRFLPDTLAAASQMMVEIAIISIWSPGYRKVIAGQCHPMRICSEESSTVFCALDRRFKQLVITHIGRWVREAASHQTRSFQVEQLFPQCAPRNPWGFLRPLQGLHTISGYHLLNVVPPCAYGNALHLLELPKPPFRGVKGSRDQKAWEHLEIGFCFGHRPPPTSYCMNVTSWCKMYGGQKKQPCISVFFPL